MERCRKRDRYIFSKELPLVKEGAIEDNYRIVEEDDANGNPARVLRFSLPVLPDDEQREPDHQRDPFLQSRFVGYRKI